MGVKSLVKSLFTREVFEEAKEQLILAAPAFVAQFCRIAVYIVNGLFLVRPMHFKASFSILSTRHLKTWC